MVGLDADDVPADAAGIEAYYESIRPELRCDADVRATAGFLVAPTFPWGLGWTPVRPLWWGVSAYAFGLLPAWARCLYGLPGLPTTDLAATLTSRAIRSAIRALPTSKLEGPLYRAAMSRAAAAEAARAESTTRKAGAQTMIKSTSPAGTTKARRRRPTSSPVPATTPMIADPTMTPA